MVSVKALSVETHVGPRNSVCPGERSPRQVLLADAEDVEALGLKPGGLRENMLLRGVGVSKLPSGTILECGPVSLRLTFDCEPCGHLIDKHPGRGLTLSGLKGRRGVLATVLSGGTVKISNPVRVGKMAAYEPLSSDVKGRIHWLLRLLPKGRVATYESALLWVGAPSGYSRALPAMLKSGLKLDPTLAAHRLVESSGRVPTQHLPHACVALRAEGVEVDTDGKVNLQAHSWQPTHKQLYLRPADSGSEGSIESGKGGCESSSAPPPAKKRRTLVEVVLGRRRS